jgi:tetratricopeptide (TPR) repeat protein
MRSCVFLLLLTAAAASCEPAPAPRVDAPVAPLVIGVSPPGPAPSSTETAPPPDEPVVIASALAIPARDPRITHGGHRPRALLVTELQGLESLYAASQPSSPDRPVIARRLADTYAELARAAEGTPMARTAHGSSFKYYEVLTTEYPQSAQLDEAYYYAALEHELAGDVTNARRSYYELIKRFPSSRLVAFAYFAFGEMFFADAANDPSKDQLAEQAFREVLKFPPAQNALYTEAQRRLAEIAMRGSRRPKPP